MGSILFFVKDVADADEPDSSADEVEERGEDGEDSRGVVAEVDQAGREKSVGKQVECGDEHLRESLAENPSLGVDDTSSSEHHHHDERYGQDAAEDEDN